MIPKKRIPISHLLVFGWLPSFLKVWAYRTFCGYRIGRRVSIQFGGVIVGKHVEIADHVEIGLLAVVMGRHITIGRHSSVGTMSSARVTSGPSYSRTQTPPFGGS